jgi:prepilin-type N-terminal cleavage/methylation domain-containing protein
MRDMTRSGRFSLRPSRDEGLTLVELLVTIVLIAIVGTLVLAAVIRAGKVLVHTEDENKGLQDAKVILERMSRDVREARGVVCDAAATDPTCQYHLQLWVDGNSDYLQQSSEVITWELKDNADGEHFDVFRTVGLGAGAVARRQASTLIVKTVFSYETGKPIDKSQVVHIGMTYDALVGRGTNERKAALTVRLRNKGTK